MIESWEEMVARHEWEEALTKARIAVEELTFIMNHEPGAPPTRVISYRSRAQAAHEWLNARWEEYRGVVNPPRGEGPRCDCEAFAAAHPRRWCGS